MLKNLIELVKENAGDAILNNPAIPKENSNAVIQEVAISLFKALKGTAKTQGFNSIRNIFRQGSVAPTNPLINSLSAGVAGDLTKKFGLNKGIANSLAAMLIPVVINKLISKTNDPNDNSFDIDDIVGAIAGKRTGGLLGALKGLLGR